MTDRRLSVCSPFHRYGLYRNPFGELSRTERVELAIVDEGFWQSKIPKQNEVLQIVGDCGHGKTTHLLALHQRMPDCSYLYLPEDGPKPSIPNHRPLIVDESQRLTRKQLRMVLQQGGELILGTHSDHTEQIQQSRLSVETVVVSTLLSSQRLLCILNLRIQASVLGSAKAPQLTLMQMDYLRARFGSNIRAMEHFLYEQFQSCLDNQSEWPPPTEA